MSAATRRGVSILDVVVTIGILLVLFAVLMPAFRPRHDRGFTPRCKNNLKQLGLALHNYHDVHNSFPPGWVAVRGTADRAPGGSHGWGTLILPYMDHAPLFKCIDFEQPFGKSLSSRADARPVVNVTIPGYRCPKDGGTDQSVTGLMPGLGTTNYIGNFGVGLPAGFGPLDLPQGGQYFQGMFGCNSSVRLRDVTDGTSNTVLVGERRLPTKGQGGDWPEHGVEGSFNSYWSGIPRVGIVSPLSIVGTVTSGDVSDSSLLNRDGDLIGLGTADQPGGLAVFGVNVTADGEPLGESQRVSPGFSSRHADGCHVLLGDGTVKFINQKIDRRVLVKLVRRADGLVVGDY